MDLFKKSNSNKATNYDLYDIFVKHKRKDKKRMKKICKKISRNYIKKIDSKEFKEI